MKVVAWPVTKLCCWVGWEVILSLNNSELRRFLFSLLFTPPGSVTHLLVFVLMFSSHEFYLVAFSKTNHVCIIVDICMCIWLCSQSSYVKYYMPIYICKYSRRKTLRRFGSKHCAISFIFIEVVFSLQIFHLYSNSQESLIFIFLPNVKHYQEGKGRHTYKIW